MAPEDFAAARAEVERLKADLQWSEQARGECLLLIDQLKIRPSPGSLWQQAEADLARVRAAAEDHIQWLRFQHESYERVDTVVALRVALEGRV